MFFCFLSHCLVLFFSCSSLCWGTLWVQRLRSLRKCAPRTHLKSFVFPWRSLHFLYKANSRCNFCEVSKSVCPVHTWNPSFSHGNPYIFLSIWRPTLGQFLRNLEKLAPRTHPESFSFLCIQRHILGAISAKAPKVCVPYTPEIFHSHMEFLIFSFPSWGPLYVQLLRSLQKHLESFIFLRKSLHLSFHTHAYARCNFCEVSKGVRPVHTWNLSCLRKTVHLPLHTEAQSTWNFCEVSKSVRPVHIWNPSFADGNP